ncbi:unnamed protein product [Soboliphyme baturini]|uniref:TPR_REGION domain-containing protein n=1 Tax=Soboliphyme baturini TaxID=241478 RepID=A0A183IWP3_9BILA|nr:unnamed protein product [Soboliphyme baturini]
MLIGSLLYAEFPILLFSATFVTTEPGNVGLLSSNLHKNFQTKVYWKRYIYLWINYAVYEELDAHNDENAREIYKTCLDLLPHKKFTFAKIWLLFAQFEIRQKNLNMARKILGTAIGKCPKDKLFKGYIDLELQLREFDRCRILYGKFLDFAPENCATWIKFAEMESLLGDVERARGIYELAIAQPALDMPEVLWKSYIDFETTQEEYDKARRLYRLLLDRTNHVKVWISLAKFEQSVSPEKVDVTRAVYRKANEALRTCEEKEQRLMLLEAWKQFEAITNGDAETLKEVEGELPKRVKKRRQIFQENGVAGWEEYYDYIFPSDESSQWSLKLLSVAKQWKQKQAQSSTEVCNNKNDLDGRNTENTQPKQIKEESSEKVREGDSDTDIESDDE